MIQLANFALNADVDSLKSSKKRNEINEGATPNVECLEVLIVIAKGSS